MTAAVDPDDDASAAHRRPHRRQPRTRRWPPRSPRRDFDAAIIAVPHHLHEPIATEALNAGLHVMLEKPLAPTVDACDRILAAANAAGTVFMVAENAQYWPEVLTVRDLDQRRRDRRRGHRPRRDVLPRARRLLRRRPAVAVRRRGRGRRRGDRHRLALAAAVAGLAGRGATKSSPRSAIRIPTWRASRSAARCCASSRAPSPRSTRCSRPARSRTNRSSP